jgi:putative ABC transport system permease protein
LTTWLDSTLPADIYVTTESWSREGELAVMEPEIVAALIARPGVIGSEQLRQVRLEAHGRRIRLNGVAFARPDSAYALPIKEGDTATALRRLRQGAVIISEPLARRARVGLGDSLRVMTGRGAVALPVAAITFDYSSEAGVAFCSPATLERLAGPGPVNNVSLTLAPGLDPERVSAELRAEYAGTPLWIRSNRQLRTDVMALFDQTFAVTRLLQGMALLIAVCGVSLTLLVQTRERAAELALYRALGATSGQVFRLLAAEGAAMGLLGALLGLAGGVGLAQILIHVINPQWFGWSIRSAWPLADVARQLLLILLAALAASLLPARRGSATPARELTREDLG